MPDRSLPDRPSLRFLKLEAKRRHDNGEFDSLHAAQWAIAREHGFPSWPRLKAFVESSGLARSARAVALVGAAVSSDPRAASVLLEADPDLAATDVAAACVTGRPEVVAAHLAVAGPDDPIGPFGWPPLLYACQSRLLRTEPDLADQIVECARLLLTAGADPNVVVSVDSDAESQRLTSLGGAAGVANHAGLTSLLLHAGASPDEGWPDPHPDDPDAGGTWGPEALYHACEFADTECLRLLLEARPHPVRVSYCLGRALDFADPERALLFLQHGAAPDGGMLKAVTHGRASVVVEAMLERGADPNRMDQQGTSLLAHAVRGGHDELASLLLRKGADPATVTAQDRAIGALDVAPDPAQVHRAIRRGDTELVRRYLAAGTDPNGTSHEGPHLTTATWVGQAEIIRLLLDAGADTQVRNVYGGSPLTNLMHGSLNCFDAEGGPAMRPVSEIPQAGYVEATELLIAAGAELPPHTGGSDAVADVLRRHGVPDL
jgi:ankyrin repeat protein